MNKMNKMNKTQDQVNGVSFVETSTIKARYAKVFSLDMLEQFLVEILEPFHMVPAIHTVSLAKLLLNSNNSHDALKEELLKNWHSQLEKDLSFISKDKDIMASIEWMKKVDKVELIECDLLVPKEK